MRQRSAVLKPRERLSQRPPLLVDGAVERRLRERPGERIMHPQTRERQQVIRLVNGRRESGSGVIEDDFGQSFPGSPGMTIGEGDKDRELCSGSCEDSQNRGSGIGHECDDHCRSGEQNERDQERQACALPSDRCQTQAGAFRLKPRFSLHFARLSAQ